MATQESLASAINFFNSALAYRPPRASTAARPHLLRMYHAMLTRSPSAEKIFIAIGRDSSDVQEIVEAPALLSTCMSCAAYGSEHEFASVCSRCRGACYCRVVGPTGLTCQKQHWQQHKRDCCTEPVAKGAIDDVIKLHGVLRSVPWLEALLYPLLVRFHKRGWIPLLYFDYSEAGPTLLRLSVSGCQPQLALYKLPNPLPLLVHSVHGIMPVHLAYSPWIERAELAHLWLALQVVHGASDGWPRNPTAATLDIDLRAARVRFCSPTDISMYIKEATDDYAVTLAPMHGIYRQIKQNECKDDCVQRHAICARYVCTGCLLPCTGIGFLCMTCRSEIYCGDICRLRARRNLGTLECIKRRDGAYDAALHFLALLRAHPWMEAVLAVFVENLALLECTHYFAKIVVYDEQTFALHPMRLGASSAIFVKMGETRVATVAAVCYKEERVYLSVAAGGNTTRLTTGQTAACHVLDEVMPVLCVQDAPLQECFYLVLSSCGSAQFVVPASIGAVRAAIAGTGVRAEPLKHKRWPIATRLFVPHAKA